ncbi:hypothetical protein AURDEDRAFT_123902 [Auricularia subglabra TFB-10046 SS5]|nr:hypothetical protein AURDEDRAFT_123902 [Auricularia subglabra TFB-10046 SS5]
MAETTYSVTYDDHDPPVVYAPLGTWSQSGGMHVTSTAGSSFSFDFFGNELELRGTVAAVAQYTVSLDGAPATPQRPVSSTVLGQWKDLSNTKHTMKVELVSGRLSFDEAQFSVGTGLTGATVRTQEIGYADMTRWTYDTGAWKPGVTTGQAKNTLRTVNVDSPAAIVIEGDAAWLLGSVFPDHGQILVHLDDKQFGPFDSSAQSFIPRSTLFYTPLEKGKNHTLWMVNRTLNKFVDLEGVRIVSFEGGSPFDPANSPPPDPPQSSEPTSTSNGGHETPNPRPDSQSGSSDPPASGQSPGSKSAPVGVIAGVVVAVVILALLASASVFLLRRRRKRTQERDTKPYIDTSMEEDDAHATVATPWVHSRSASPAPSGRKCEIVVPPNNSYLAVPTNSPPSTQTQHQQSIVVAQVDMDQILQYVASRMDSSGASSSGRGSVVHDDTAPPRGSRGLNAT